MRTQRVYHRVLRALTLRDCVSLYTDVLTITWFKNCIFPMYMAGYTNVAFVPFVLVIYNIHSKGSECFGEKSGVTDKCRRDVVQWNSAVLHPFIYLFIYLFIISVEEMLSNGTVQYSIHSFIYLFTYLFIYLFIDSLTWGIHSMH